MRKIIATLLLASTLAAPLAGCATTQASAPCIVENLLADEATFEQIMSDSTLTLEQRIEKAAIVLGPQAITCVMEAKKAQVVKRGGMLDAGTGSGSGSGSAK